MVHFRQMMLRTSSLAIERELDWYFNVSPSECGVKSNFSTIVQFMRYGCHISGGPHGQEFEQERNLATAERNRKVYRALSAIPAIHRAVLTAAYEPRAFDEDLRDYFGDRRVGVALHVPVAVALAEEAQLSVSEYLKVCDDDAILSAIRTQADDMLFAAHDAFKEAFRASSV